MHYVECHFSTARVLISRCASKYTIQNLEFSKAILVYNSQPHKKKTSAHIEATAEKTKYRGTHTCSSEKEKQTRLWSLSHTRKYHRIGIARRALSHKLVKAAQQQCSFTDPRKKGPAFLYTYIGTAASEAIEGSHPRGYT